MDNFPVNHIPSIVPVSSHVLANAFHEIDRLRAMLTTEEARAVLTRLELLVEDMAGV
ncbi:hypothetical protein R69658_02534 [Paraburkholderia aspalathi]|uniref:Uncharacterized protein n=1 Tax=Paraburkholderia aspalathi TaxID=1324617 RepID=A0ABM8RDP0_9BURK|nr:hypothetical protein [Paraburkholderia aspalathi]MBK3817798.1 hypothetical protein [Paraburkholderia aspalathi]MBK3829586.1 hypothetical protein [Paraburkholderia aspalathi]MBK3859406.1 hypothetical protein [Paraburkholderia aspalathi]CAE6747005.1 hypothetical protein R69658_02534 [Paraburkholderia aspalathi]